MSRLPAKDAAPPSPFPAIAVDTSKSVPRAAVMSTCRKTQKTRYRRCRRPARRKPRPVRKKPIIPAILKFIHGRLRCFGWRSLPFCFWPMFPPCFPFSPASIGWTSHSTSFVYRELLRIVVRVGGILARFGNSCIGSRSPWSSFGIVPPAVDRRHTPRLPDLARRPRCLLFRRLSTPASHVGSRSRRCSSHLGMAWPAYRPMSCFWRRARRAHFPRSWSCAATSSPDSNVFSAPRRPPWLFPARCSRVTISTKEPMA